ncbi:hypothetical protein M2451_001592 [Dysgonomonas sp. PFB1-18]|uniref:DUF4377 domain-containing protein n=1 Tax=unclassified Dysgonomonas TaxID=2630389 RepID=UPI002476A7DC|nr:MULTISPECIES: DUF4377 domain-containing protein [unclassified Dysgonomonas]MDH6308950.1 hypothetical protein [Dysgonomonas sp. PF1-14]MDH6338701.1 hypothetical protein [Dysgonomonas sp. PF1-16]MDH6380271.1 hypothetical protein [Dysgonomonas sp. PFB1-18]MDH6397601.1 hypothetical protein [Dysgonomonas sp. PF1-23]
MHKTILLLFSITLLFGACSNKGTMEKLVIASQQGDCVGVAPMKCLLVKKEGQTNWEFFYNNIEGFNYEPGYEYVLDVKVEKIEYPAADQSALKYTLVKEVSKEQKASDNLPKMQVEELIEDITLLGDSIE